MNFLQTLSPYHLPSSRQAADEITRRREILLQFIFYVLLLVGTGAVIIALRNAGNPNYVSAVTVLIVLYLVIAAMAALRSLSFALRAVTIVATFWGAGLYFLYANGVGGASLLLLLTAVLLANLLFSARIGGGMFLLTTAAVFFTAYQILSGQMPAPEMNEVTNSAQPRAWFSAGSVFILGGSMLTIAFGVIDRHTRALIAREKELNRQIEVERAALEQRVQERSAGLRQRLAQYEIASEIAREIAVEENLQTLLDKAVRLIGHRFHFYHVGLFLNDERGEYTVLRAAAGQAGQQMIERNHRLKIGEIGIVGNVVSKGEARIAMDVNDDIVHYKNPLLPDTRSEMALPLRYGGQVVGALDVQSTDENAFAQEDRKILQTVADQLAIALAKSQQSAELQRSLADLEASHAQIVQQAWQGHLKAANRKYGYQYHNAVLTPGAPETEHSRRALTTGQIVRTTVPGSDPDQRKTVLAVPIKLRNQVLGVIDIHFQGAGVTQDLISLIEAAVDRLAVSLENARLLEEIQFRAQRERLVGEISSRVRTASDVDSILRITAQEIGRSLGVAEVMVQLRSSEQA